MGPGKKGPPLKRHFVFMLLIALLSASITQAETGTFPNYWWWSPHEDPMLITQEIRKRYPNEPFVRVTKVDYIVDCCVVVTFSLSREGDEYKTIRVQNYFFAGTF